MGNICTHCQFDFDKARQESSEPKFTMYCVGGVTVCKPCLWKHHRGTWLRFKWGSVRSWFRDHFSAVANFFSGLRFAFKPTFYVVATPQQALDLVRCLTTTASGIQYMLDSGNPASKSAAYDDPEIRKAYPMADLIRDSINGAGPRPITPYYNDVSTSVQITWHPSTDVNDPATPEETDQYMSDVLQGERLL